MSSVEIYIVVEGPTEQTFVRDVLAPQMAHKGIYLHTALIGKPGHKGGNIQFDRAKGLERNNLGNSDPKCVADLVGLIFTKPQA
ncbi:MAG: hypothetical protein U9O82_14345 [Thermodesulfobacteriota bacterium]|nr:hypothetical protein [Thermodesulfobacteriota bacterium]